MMISKTTELMDMINHRATRYLEREGIIDRVEENSYLNLVVSDEYPMQQVMDCSVAIPALPGNNKNARYLYYRPTQTRMAMTTLPRRRMNTGST